MRRRRWGPRERAPRYWRRCPIRRRAPPPPTAAPVEAAPDSPPAEAEQETEAAAEQYASEETLAALTMDAADLGADAVVREERYAIAEEGGLAEFLRRFEGAAIGPGESRPRGLGLSTSAYLDAARAQAVVARRATMARGERSGVLRTHAGDGHGAGRRRGDANRGGGDPVPGRRRQPRLDDDRGVGGGTSLGAVRVRRRGQAGGVGQRGRTPMDGEVAAPGGCGYRCWGRSPAGCGTRPSSCGPVGFSGGVVDHGAMP